MSDKNKFKKWEEINSFDKPMLEFFLNYSGNALHMRFLGRTDFNIDDPDIISSYTFLGRKVTKSLGDDANEEYYKEYYKFEEHIKQKGDKIMELIYNVIHAEGIKVLEEYKEFQQKWIDKIDKNSNTNE